MRRQLELLAVSSRWSHLHMNLTDLLGCLVLGLPPFFLLFNCLLLTVNARFELLSNKDPLTNNGVLKETPKLD